MQVNFYKWLNLFGIGVTQGDVAENIYQIPFP